MVVLADKVYLVGDKFRTAKEIAEEKVRDMYVYITGAISNDRECKHKFMCAEAYLRSLGFKNILNPVTIVGEETNWYTCMKLVLVEMIQKADVVVRLHDWEVSEGAMTEVSLAEKLGVVVWDYVDVPSQVEDYEKSLAQNMALHSFGSL